MIYVMVYKAGTVNVVACLTRKTAQRYAKDSRYTLVTLRPPKV